jgi:hypothetical protein
MNVHVKPPASPWSNYPPDYATNDVPPEEDHDEPYSSGLWAGVALTGAFVVLVLAAFAIKEMMTWVI